MQTESIQLNNGQYIGEVLKDIPTNTILDKTICGCGATTLEIETPRHSIIIEPNLPVILGKQDGHPDMLGVYEAVTVPKVEEYLQEYANSYEPLINTDGKIRYELPKKIYYKMMTTPEGFHKVKKAINNSGMNLYQDFFLLFDECEKASQDVDYRNSILNPIDDFFLCNNKAMVSATPIIVNDPRFEQQEFKKIKVAPTYDYRQPLSLVITTNVNNILDYILRKLPQHLKACIFFNTTEGIKEVVEKMHLKGQSNIFCGAESRSKLVKENIQSVYTNLVKIDGKIQLERYNFFTSRFFSAVDIILDTPPVVIIVTDVYKSIHSIIDPYTEAVQIAGRFRNGIHKLYHITNFNSTIEPQNKEQIEQFLHEQHEYYTMLRELSETATTGGSMTVADQSLTRVDYAKYILPNGDPNFFMYNNTVRDEQVRGWYRTPKHIIEAYNHKSFAVTPYFVKYEMSDEDRQKLEEVKNKSQQEANQFLLELREKLENPDNHYDDECKKYIDKNWPLVAEGCRELGVEGMRSLPNLKNLTILDKIKKSREAKQYSQNCVVTAVYDSFKVGETYLLSEVNEKLKAIFITNGIRVDKRGVGKALKKYFEAEECWRQKSKAVRIIRKIEMATT